MNTPSPQPSARPPWSRLTLVGEYTLDSALRIASGPTGEALAMDADNKPIIPASTFRGALRSTIEAALRALSSGPNSKFDTRRTVTLRGPEGRATPTARVVKLCCDSVDKRDDDLSYQGCLTRAIVKQWEADPVLRPTLDSTLVDCTCLVCRLFGTPWLAGRVYVADLKGVDWKGDYARRGGLSISRETDTAIEGSAYQRQALPAGLRFRFRLTVENATPIEQGIVLMGLRSFVDGAITLGMDRSRGMGRGHLSIDWWNCRYVDDTQLVSALLVGTDPQVFSEADAEARISSLAAFLRSP